MSAPHYSLKALSDEQLLLELARLSKQSNELTAELLAHLAEADARRLYLQHACGSLFAYCLERLGYTEDEAGRRIQAARAARRFPVILEMVARGELHLSTINLLSPHLDEPGGEALLTAARGLTKRQTEELLAARFPKADVASSLRRLPDAAQLVAREGTLPLLSGPGPATALQAAPQGPSPAPSPTPPPAESAGQCPMPLRLTAPPATPVRSGSPTAVLTPLSAERYLSRPGRCRPGPSLDPYLEFSTIRLCRERASPCVAPQRNCRCEELEREIVE